MNNKKFNHQEYIKKSIYSSYVKYILDLPVFTESIKELNDVMLKLLKTKKGGLFCCLNPHSYVLSRIYPDFNHSLSGSTFIICDGLLTWLIFKLRHPFFNIKRITGRMLFNKSIEIAIEKNIPSYAILPNKESQKRFEKYALEELINLKSSFVFPYLFRHDIKQFNIKELENFEEDKVFFVYIFIGAPKQEVLAAKLRIVFPKAIIIPVGGVIEEIGLNNTQDCKNKLLFSKLGLEWVFRLIKNPKRIWKRIFISAPLYIILMFIRFLKFPIRKFFLFIFS